MEYHGRNDEQVKLRGYRIERGEIVSVMEKMDGVMGAVVCLQGEGEDRELIGYYTGERHDEEAL
ncbi:hypothetical protein, partial [Tolypothrix sp. VBCCA 56010]|uniref:hypothetical protein n=1 Tax=Tolypothrix sp. VBCCA 56010 TaxID=3137731 RepID=UPI003D7E0F8A